MTSTYEEMTASAAGSDALRAARKRADEQMRLQAVAAYTDDAVLITDADPLGGDGPRVLYANEAFSRMTGYTPGEIQGRTPRLLQGAETSTEARAFIRERLQRRQGFTCSVLNYRKDGSPFWVLLSVQPVIDGDGHCTHFVGIQRDITRQRAESEERDAAATALRETERRLSAAQSTAHIGSWEYDIASGAITWSPETFRLLQFDPAEGEPDFDRLQRRYHPDDRAVHAAAVQRAATLGTPYQLDLRAVLDDGTIRWLRASGQASCGTDGTVMRLTGVVQDVTDRKDLFNALRRSEQGYRQIVETASEGIWTTDAEGRTLVMNSKMAQMLGYPPDDMIGKRLRYLVAESSVAVMRAGLERRRQGISETYEVQLRHRERGDFWAEISASPIFGPDGEFEGSLAMVTDISERKQQESALRESEARFRSTFDDAAVGMVINSIEGVLLQVNDAFCRFLGRSRDDLIGTSVAALSDQDTWRHRQEMRRRCINGEIPFYRMEKRYHHKEGRPLWGDLTSSVVRDPQTGEPLYFIAQIVDITARKRLEHQMIQSEKLASLGELVAGVAHEINNPLSVISGQAQLLQMHDDPMVRTDAQTIRAMAERTARIVRALRSYTQPSDFTGATRTTPGDLNAVVRTALEMMVYKLRGADIHVETDLADDLGAAPMNAGEIEQVLVNLFTNAAHALRDVPRERRRIRIRSWNTDSPADATAADATAADATAAETAQTEEATPSTGAAGDGDSDADAVALSVSDEGVGMTPETLARVFDPFFTTKDTDEGTGLGLYISHSIVAAHGGTICVTSAYRSGTTFTVRLPRR